MERISWLIFLAVLAHNGRGSLSSSGAPLENPFPLGTIGCLVSDVCGPGQVCKDDLLFGSCQTAYVGAYRNGGDMFRLETSQIEQLEETIWTLIQGGFTWQDAYTQCALQNLLVAFRRGRRFGPRLCEEALGVSLPGSEGTWAEDASSDIATVLGELLQSPGAGRPLSAGSFPPSLRPQSAYPQLDGLLKGGERYGASEMYPDERGQGYGYGEEGMERLGSNKRDEFVQVHKYFDQSKGQLKRDPFLGGGGDMIDPYNFLMAFPQQAVVMNDNGGGDIAGDDAGLQYLPGVPEAAQEEAKEEDGRFFDLAPGDASVGMESSMGMGGPEPDMPLATASADEETPATEGGQEEEEEAPLALSPRDQATLEDLLQGTVEPDQLPLDQQRRLSKFIEMMIDTLEMRNNDHMDDVDVVDEGLPQSLPPTDQEPIATQEPTASTNDDNNDPVKADVSEDGTGDEEGKEKEAEEEVVEPETNGRDDAGKDNDVVDLDKKSPPEEEEEEEKSGSADNQAVVKTGYTSIKLNKIVDEAKAERFVENLTKTLHVPEGVATLDQVNGDQLILKIAPHSQWNSSKLAREAEDHSEALYRDTGLKVVDAGIGKGVTVEVQKKGAGNVVITFILVGSIAGVVLAVTIIYLLKRHRRSQEKLAQLATSGDGNEASKDYQDLCRQRMQSKASEKPEPLHAASRIGSVSESQVRSPSSRSSTSSWSEEPAATNMDISTGHVVLAYMEDHLKNGDRLEQEWEALAAYQADPCSTTIAGDSSNTRKNRYSDVLPYDHSRVVLSAGTNVSNSDYVNASFITDHDPRNPAYICTQGPLPHTVSDFWQMIWEQGSVVIVMLTKLTENGTAMCHRYWPEEGSDLYHIYEVHLVSEHIWCDDYLVRSFYLKNLQTNETRTVTQFHFLTWPHLSVPPSMKALLDFRRKVNKSFRGGSCPIVLHCNDGCGRSGTYCLIDMVLNRMAKGAKEIDMAATLEHIRDQRMNMVQTKEQFQFALSAVAEEVHAILKAMPQ